MNDEILTINDYPIGWGWLKDVPLQDWEWLIDVFATMTDNTDTYSYITYAELNPYPQISKANIKS